MKKAFNISEKALRRLAAYENVFANPLFSFGEWIAGYFDMSEPAEQFVQDAYDHKWMMTGFDWPAWAKSNEGASLRFHPQTIEQAIVDQLAKLLTACIRSERFCEGALAEAYHAGVLTRITRRARCLIAEADAQSR